MFRIILREMFRIKFRIKLYYVRLVLTKYSKAHNFENIQISEILFGLKGQSVCVTLNSVQPCKRSTNSEILQWSTRLQIIADVRWLSQQCQG